MNDDTPAARAPHWTCARCWSQLVLNTLRRRPRPTLMCERCSRRPVPFDKHGGAYDYDPETGYPLDPDHHWNR